MGAGKIIGGVIGMAGAILIVNVVINYLTLGVFGMGMMYIANWGYYIAVVALAVIGCIIAWTSGKKASGILLIIAGAMAIVMAINYFINPILGEEPYSILAQWIPALSAWPVTLESIIILVGGLVCVFTKAN